MAGQQDHVVAHNVRRIAHLDIPGGGQVVVADDRAYVGQTADLGLGETLYLAFRPEACTVFRL